MYDGSWANDRYNGSGTEYNRGNVLNMQVDYKNLTNIDSFWTKYEGNFKNDCLQFVLNYF